jgi:4a-hydroxytetrahydrobiopterin dehydratase
MAPKIHPDWKLVDNNHHLERTWKFSDWLGAVAFLNKVSPVAEALQHHPDVELGWGRVTLKLRTHDEGAVGSKDYELASKIDGLM